MRLDSAIAARYPQFSRRKARELIAARRVLVNERVVAVASREIELEDRIAVVEELSPLDVIASADEWIAINKPSGLPTQPSRDRTARSLEELLRLQYREIHPVHRLDTPTSGVVLFARTTAAAARFSALFAAGAMKKLYVARIERAIDGERRIDSTIRGRSAVTIVRPMSGSLVEVEIHTGRTHQIRIHLASIGHPVVGDRRYGGPFAARLMLHAWRLEHESVGTLEAPVPAELTNLESRSR